MIERILGKKLIQALSSMPVTGLLGSRQVGKTTLALEISEKIDKDSIYIDLELDSDFAKLQDAEAYLKQFSNKLVIIDEAQRKPDLFQLLRSLVDQRKQAGEKNGQFLLLGSASRELIQQSSETLAGRIRFLELTPFTVDEVGNDQDKFNVNDLWFRGGFPDSYLATDDDSSWEWRKDFISTYVERDIPLMGPDIPATRMKRFWSMLAHLHGQTVNQSALGKSMELSNKTIRSYLDTLTDFYMVRQLQPWSGNSKKRLVKSPKIYIRDTGLLHSLLNISEFDDLLGHPIIGTSWEGFVIENIISNMSSKWQYSYYRTSAQAEIDLVLEGPGQQKMAIEIKRSSAPKVTKGFHLGCEDIRATQKLLIYPGNETFPISDNIEVIGLQDFLIRLKK